ncbi:hypothetical protein A6M27_19875 [Acidithiobacillus thiooxidans]|uniref:Uncharacterized protein n=1 Tax=Acidithiobacillus thiooxidans TaxID=930 RepID=A0A1C2I0S5_ACITH|nr:hypothetical protein [Acidithiobacillus thiooxidans]OCX69616.1 hypothetical protein A6O24_18035 [Acidithiobacillus thiooxidans]OCX72594.1 hypothetical protein A6P07_09505 [Acidithiobacillus thiooxidans]OCX77522.1 hypothetical protein A6O26_19865 [Acidithiobacillus thiooxidans]OCX81222.1 hypothetical protein A6M27_19875 [Acidithiobacillus thiooxidans]OFC43279.1 hypothetical protein BAE47_13225 [Acidithiobacillus thiooxidans]
MTTQVTTRPDVFFGMNNEEMGQVRCWLEHYTRQIRALRLDRRAYARGVTLGLNAIGLGHSMLPGASTLSQPWTDAMGTEWEWDGVNLQPVSNPPEADLDASGLDFSDLPDEEFAIFARGLLDSVVACGWMAPYRRVTA